MNKKPRMILVCTVVTLVLAACTGPETRVLPRQRVLPEESYELPGAESVLEEVNPFYLQEALDFLARTPRECGSDAESNAAEYIRRLLIEYGYEVTLQRFPVRYEARERHGTNVVAIKRSKQATGDVILVTAGHDSAADSPGANSNASGVVVLLETARLISKMPTDTEIRFVSFAGAQKDGLGTRYYLESLTEEERSHIIGVLHLDSLGYIYDQTISLGSVDGRPTMLGDYLQETAKSELTGVWSYRMDDTGSYTLFDSYRIPAVRIAQRMTAFEQGTPQDRSDIVDAEQLGEVSRVLSKMLADMMSVKTGAYLEVSRSGNYERDGAWLQRTDRSIPFGFDRDQVKAYYGSSGTYAGVRKDGSEVFQYPVKWLEVDQIILSDFCYQEGFLQSIILQAESAGIEADEMQQRLEALYGEADEVRNEENQRQLQWHDIMGNLLFTMEESEDGFTVWVTGREPEILELARYSFDETAEGELLAMQMEAAVELAGTVLTPAMQAKIGEIVLFTDGIGGQTVYWDSIDTGHLYLDLADIADQDGSYRDYNKSCRELVRACAYFYEQQHWEAFYTRFPESGSADFYTSFQYFVLSRQPDSDITEADAKTMFFYQDTEMVNTRTEIRNQLGWNEYE